MWFESGCQIPRAEAYALLQDRRNGREDRRKRHNHQYPDMKVSQGQNQKSDLFLFRGKAAAIRNSYVKFVGNFHLSLTEKNF